MATSSEKESQGRKGHPPHPCACGGWISAKDSHGLYISCLGAKHAQAALSNPEGCPHCATFSTKTRVHRMRAHPPLCRWTQTCWKSVEGPRLSCQSVVLFRRASRVHIVSAPSGGRYRDTSDSSGETRFQDKPEKELSEPLTGDNLLNEQRSGFAVPWEPVIRGVETSSPGGSNYLAEIRSGCRRSDSNSTILAGETVGRADCTAALRPAMAITSTQGSSLSSRKQNRDAEAVSVGLARERLNLNAVGLPPKVIETIPNTRAASTHSLYSLKWGVFKVWCAERHVVPYLCSISDALCFLQDLLDKGRAFSTVKVYLAAISACHIRLDAGTIGQHPLVCRFMRGARWLRSVSKPLVPPWDLSVVLNALSKAPFEPVESIPLKLLSLKTALLLALTTAKRVSELYTLSVHSSCMRFAPGGLKVTFKTNPAFLPKVFDHSGSDQSVDLMAFHPPPFSSSEEERLHCLCPLRTLQVYVQRTKALRKSNQLFVLWADSFKEKPISRQRLSHWVVEAIVLCYNNVNVEPPRGLRAHSTRDRGYGRQNSSPCKWIRFDYNPELEFICFDTPLNTKCTLNLMFSDAHV
ncbi:hypothetical protein QQF64_013389 [Cirrhinus molitorella]|uniref:Uncharacterized protein n=1 Tax=Cirrhinus molitorella TaxID=172907 RepID=A0ABR3LR32_9TELE